ncbi:MAG TPA: DUF2269 domain-containing protein [Rickettsiales bacterium]|nr:DUF2269 domain-containing protein [Rickettsiales bacterium]
MLLEWIHILNSIILLGTAVGGAFFLFMANRSREPGSIYFSARNVVRMNWMFTLPTGVIQPATGMMMMHERDYSFTEGWLVLAVMLYLFAAVCWVMGALQQSKMRDMAQVAFSSREELPPRFRQMHRNWEWLAVIAFLSLAGISYLMVVKPQIAFLSGLVAH